MDQTSRNPRIQLSRFLTHTRLRTLCAARALFGTKEDDVSEALRAATLSELDEALQNLRFARSCFSRATDPDLVEAWVYEMKSAESRYSYLLRRAKETGLTQTRRAR